MTQGQRLASLLLPVPVHGRLACLSMLTEQTDSLEVQGRQRAGLPEPILRHMSKSGCPWAGLYPDSAAWGFPTCLFLSNQDAYCPVSPGSLHIS